MKPDYSRAVRLNPQNALYYGNRALTRFYLRRDRDGENDLKKTYEIDPVEGRSYTALADRSKARRTSGR